MEENVDKFVNELNTLIKNNKKKEALAWMAIWAWSNAKGDFVEKKGSHALYKTLEKNRVLADTLQFKNYINYLATSGKMLLTINTKKHLFRKNQTTYTINPAYNWNDKDAKEYIKKNVYSTELGPLMNELTFRSQGM